MICNEVFISLLTVCSNLHISDGSNCSMDLVILVILAMMRVDYKHELAEKLEYV